jgi:hypothetical protein
MSMIGTLGYLLSHSEELKRFLAHGAQEGLALLVSLN